MKNNSWKIPFSISRKRNQPDYLVQSCIAFFSSFELKINNIFCLAVKGLFRYLDYGGIIKQRIYDTLGFIDTYVNRKRYRAIFIDNFLYYLFINSIFYFPFSEEQKL